MRRMSGAMVHDGWMASCLESPLYFLSSRGFPTKPKTTEQTLMVSVGGNLVLSKCIFGTVEQGTPGKEIWRRKSGQRGLQVQLKEDGDGCIRQSWSDTSGLWLH